MYEQFNSFQTMHNPFDRALSCNVGFAGGTADYSTASVRRLWTACVGDFMGFYGGIYTRKAGSESLLQRQRQRIGGRDKTNTLLLKRRVPSRFIRQLF